jgi:hypothetical protein
LVKYNYVAWLEKTETMTIRAAISSLASLTARARARRRQANKTIAQQEVLRTSTYRYKFKAPVNINDNTIRN